MSERVYEDAFNLLCGELLGSGAHRKVFACKLRPDLVVKVEEADNRYFANVHEMKFWCDNQYYTKVAQWLAPCEYLSPDGRLLLQKRVAPLGPDEKLPSKLPAFLTDLKRSNFGRIGKRLVCVDYAMVLGHPSVRERRVNWYD